ncbi:MAG: DUF2505 domain-containing protein [Actinomycetota bacterium]
MEFEMAHEFEADVSEVAEAILDLDFQASLADVGRLAGREVLSQDPDGEAVIRRTRCILDIDISGPAKRFIGDGDPAWVEVARWDPEAMVWEWHIEPEIAADLLEARGTTELKPSKNGTIRHVTGKVRVKVPLYGGKVEGWIVDGLESAYDEEAQRLADWLAR